MKRQYGRKKILVSHAHNVAFTVTYTLPYTLLEVSVYVYVQWRSCMSTLYIYRFIHSFILALQPHSSHDRSNVATQIHYVRYLDFPVVNSTSFKVFFNTAHPSYRVSSYIPRTVWIYECQFPARLELVCCKWVSQSHNFRSFNLIS